MTDAPRLPITGATDRIGKVTAIALAKHAGVTVFSAHEPVELDRLCG